MAKLVTKFKFIKPGDRAGSYLKYIATREGVDRIDESKKHLSATIKQKKLIESILRDFPDTKEMHEYVDYQNTMTTGNASEFITRALEDNAHKMMDGKTYADYIATRPRTQKFGSHGLFTDDGVEINLTRVSEELNLHNGNVWTAILSLHREDAVRLGFDDGYRWRDMLRTQTETLSKNIKIPIEHLRWFAAFHDESYHPHVHLIVYSVVENEGYLTRQGVNNLRSSIARDIFAQDLLCVYEEQNKHRDALKSESRHLVEEIVLKINKRTYENPMVEELLLKLSERLSRTNGKKLYGYMKSDVKDLIDSIVDELAKDESIAALYDLWYECRENIFQTYTQDMPNRIPLSENREFKFIKNAVIQEAMNLHEYFMTGEGETDVPMQGLGDDERDSATDCGGIEPIEFVIPDEKEDTGSPQGRRWLSDKERNSKGRKYKNTWWTVGYKAALKCIYGTKGIPPDFSKAFELISAEAEKGNGFAMHDLGKMYLSGLGCEKNEVLAEDWFRKTHIAFLKEEEIAGRKDYLQYRIGKLYSFGYGVEQDYDEASKWYEKAVAGNNPFAAYSLGSFYRRGQGVEQNEETAFRLYEMAATHESKSNAYAMYELGKMCGNGTGTAKDKEASNHWYVQAYEGFLEIEKKMADERVYYRLGQMNLTGTGTSRDLLSAKDCFEKAAELHNHDAEYGLGILYLNKDFEQYDVQKALEKLTKAAESGHDYAQYILGKLFLQGVAVPKNINIGRVWLEEAARQGNPAAEYLLGKACLEGHPLPQDIEKALELLSRAADRGNAPAEYLMGKLLYCGEIIPKDVGKALQHLESAIKKDNSYASFMAGTIRLKEDGYKDINEAIRLFKIASEQGNDYAEYQLGRIYLYGKETEQDMDQAIRWLKVSAEHGNLYARQLLDSIRNNRNWSAAMESLRLLQHISKILKNRLEEEREGRGSAITDRKLRRKIEAKNQALGIRQG